MDNTQFQQAIKSNNYSAVERLLRQGRNVNINGALIRAIIRNKDPNIVKLLVLNGATNIGISLSLAVRTRRMNIVRAILECDVASTNDINRAVMHFVSSIMSEYSILEALINTGKVNIDKLISNAIRYENNRLLQYLQS